MTVMVVPETDRDRARREALRVAVVLGRTPTDGHDENALDLATRLLAEWRTDDGIRAALRPLFAAAVPDQRALIALGDIDAWLPDGRIARGWWEAAARGPDPAVAAEAAWKVGRAYLRSGRTGEAAPFLGQAADGGWTEEAEARRRAAEAQAAAEAARAEEDRLRRAERRLVADDLDGAEEILRTVERPDSRPGGPSLAGWERGLRGELAFRRGALDEAADLFATASGTRRTLLREAQIAIVRGDAAQAYERTQGLTDPDDEVSAEARPLLVLHAALIAAGMPIGDAWICDGGCCCEAECQGWCGED